jgi:hypothetical protein
LLLGDMMIDGFSIAFRLSFDCCWSSDWEIKFMSTRRLWSTTWSFCVFAFYTKTSICCSLKLLRWLIRSRFLNSNFYASWLTRVHDRDVSSWSLFLLAGTVSCFYLFGFLSILGSYVYVIVNVSNSSTSRPFDTSSTQHRHSLKNYY